MKYVYRVTTEAVRETQEFAATLADGLAAGDVLALNGDLGAGKTAFAQGLAKGLGVSGHVVSPTFTLLAEYDDGRVPLYHFDAYRLNDVYEWYDSGFDDYLRGDGIAVIEWAEKIADALPDDVFRITLEKIDPGDDGLGSKRRITVTAPRALDPAAFGSMLIGENR